VREEFPGWGHGQISWQGSVVEATAVMNNASSPLGKNGYLQSLNPGTPEYQLAELENHQLFL
jgi:hypothetical protein